MSFTNLRYGFYNYNASDADPKIYDAIDVGMIFDGIITDGIYQNYKHGLYVKASEVANQVIISSGRAWFDHTWSYVDTDTVLNLSNPVSEPYSRIDAIVLDVNNITRTNAIIVVEGVQATTNPAKPTLINETGHVQHGLAFVTRVGGQNVITQDRIEDVRGQAAYNSAYVTGVLSQMTIDQIVSQWETEFNTWNEAQRESFLLWRAEREEEFIAWFNEMKGQLSEDAAGHLQNEIDDLESKVGSISVRDVGTATKTTVAYQGIFVDNVQIGIVDGSMHLDQSERVITPSPETADETWYAFGPCEELKTANSITVCASSPSRHYKSIMHNANTGKCTVIFDAIPLSESLTVRLYLR